jgi:hypothetical protein
MVGFTEDEIVEGATESRLYTQEEVDRIRIESWHQGYVSRKRDEEERQQRLQDEAEASEGWWTR